jgi:hypothetical protein
MKVIVKVAIDDDTEAELEELIEEVLDVTELFEDDGVEDTVLELEVRELLEIEVEGARDTQEASTTNKIEKRV